MHIFPMYNDFNIKIIPLLIITFLCIITPFLYARDINLDEIYIKKNSRYLKKLSLSKLNAYKDVDAHFIAKNVIFAGWISGDEIYYIKEISSANVNLIYRYELQKRISVLLFRIKGIITISNISTNGRFLIIKRLIKKGGRIPKGEMIIISLQSGRLSKRGTVSPFVDFSITGDGNSVLYEDKAGFVEYFPDSGASSIILKRSIYSSIGSDSVSSIAYTSPDRVKTLVVNGSGGNYRAKLFSPDLSTKIDGLTSSSEIYWIDNHNIVFRKGFAGNFSVVLYNIIKRKTTILLEQSYNTNINFSLHPQMLSFLKDGIILLFDTKKKLLVNTGIEGEDVLFSPNGNWFTVLLMKKLYVINFYDLKKNQFKLKRNWSTILASYRNLKNKREDLENDYSLHYIKRKINLYDKLVR